MPHNRFLVIGAALAVAALPMLAPGAHAQGLSDTPVLGWNSPRGEAAYEGCERTAAPWNFNECLSLKGFAVRHHMVVKKAPDAGHVLPVFQPTQTET